MYEVSRYRTADGQLNPANEWSQEKHGMSTVQKLHSQNKEDRTNVSLP